VRINGPIVRSPEQESDAYFASRGAGSKIGAWASQQSRPIGDRSLLLRQVAEQAERFGVPQAGGVVSPDYDADIPRPPHWGGYRLWIEEIELWYGVQNRIHDRARWRRALATGQADAGDGWSHTRLQP
jgi:pyridoxamine 5'-phosphate oxidase